jgi:triacylglycerol esterase/lipase EstA (alpha/beta hydrolase family)
VTVRPKLAATAAAVAALALPSTASAELPVPWTGDFSRQAEAPNSPPPGSNDWSCEPSPAHPDPVILVHGLYANRTVNWPTISPFLANHGYCVYALTYGTRPGVDYGFYRPGGLVRIQESARELKRFARRVMRRSGAEAVDVVGHSEGSLMPNWWVKRLGGHRVVDDYVGITPLWDGTDPAGLGSLAAAGEQYGLSQAFYELLEPHCAACRQFLVGARFIRKMNAGGGPRTPGVDYTMILTRNDELVVPYTSGLMKGARNIVVQDVCALDQAEHLSVVFDPITAYSILNVLDPARPHEVPCVPVLPVLGAVGYSE